MERRESGLITINNWSVLMHPGDTECTERRPIIHSQPTPAPVMSAQHLRWSGDIERPDIPRETVIGDTASN